MKKAESFQARVWQESVAAWNALTDAHRRQLEVLLPSEHGLGTLLRNVQLVTDD